MKDAQPRTIRLADYEPPAYRTLETELSFDLRDDGTRVESRLKLRREGAAEALVLDGENLELLSVAVNGETLSSNAYRLDDGSLTLFDLPDEVELRIVTRISPETNDALEGLYKSSGMYCTQCEAEGFRRITYYQDRPDVLSVFTTHIEADADRYPVLLANGNPVGEETRPDGRRRVTWHDPHPKPSYLFALVAGDLALLEDSFVTASGRTVVLRIYSEPHNIDQCHYAMGALKRAMRWDEEVYGREYDLDIFMVVAVEDFNMGAMENKGLNIFNTSCVLATADTATDAAFRRVEAVVAHEYFHNWSGNRVTCRDWFQLSLKEGFTVFRDAEFSADMHSRTVKRIEDVRQLRALQFAEDAGPLAHPVRPPSYMEISNFYTVTVYEKGAEVVRMLHTLLGPEVFRRGSDLYFERHDGGAVTTDDFVAAMADASGRDLSQFQRWYDQAGTPRVAVASRWEGTRLTLDFAQSCPPTPEQSEKAPFLIPVLFSLLDGDGHELPVDPEQVGGDATVRRHPSGSLLLELTDARASVTIDGLEREPVVSLLRGFSAPVRLDVERDDATLRFLAVNDQDGFARWDALQTLWMGEIERLRREPGSAVRDEVLDLAASLLEQAVAAARPQPDPERTAMLAALLTPPEENYVFEMTDPVDVDELCGARDRLLDGLASVLQPAYRTLYHATVAGDAAYAPDPASMGRRALNEVALAGLARGLPAAELTALLEAHYRQADNLSDRRMALVQAINAPLDGAWQRRLFEDFYQRWRDESLVVNLWFALQASARSTAAADIEALERHPAFDRRNPNKLRALYGAFSQQNARNFHALDGSGYRLLAERIAEVDGANPQMAAGLAKPLTRWRRYDAARQRLMVAELEALVARDGLSRDLYEVVSKSLAG